MTNEEKAALKGRFKAGKIPTELDFGALVDAIAAGSGGNSGVLMIPADSELRAKVMQRVETTHTQYTFTNPYTYTTIPELLDAYQQLHPDKDISNVDQVIIYNECWDSVLGQPEDTLWQSWASGYAVDEGVKVPDPGTSSGYNMIYPSYTAHISLSDQDFVGTSYPLYILTDHSSVLLRADVSRSVSSTIIQESGDDPMFGVVEDKVVDAIKRGRACMFIKRTRTVTGEWDDSIYDEDQGHYTFYYTKTFYYWVPVNRGTTVTTYELGQMYQDFEANPHPDSGGSSS